MSKANNIFKNLICLLIATLVSLMEVQFFSGTSIYSMAFMIVLAVTVPTIYLYFLPKHETMIIFLYSIILVYLLDFLGKDVNVRLLLVTLFFIVLLFTYSLYTANVKKTKFKKPVYLGYLITLVVILLIVSSVTLYIYEYILKPNVNEQNQLALIYENTTPSNDDMNNIQKEEADNNSSGNGGGSSSIDEPINFRYLIKLILIILINLIIIYSLYKFLKYKIWLRNTLKLSKGEQVIIFYGYFLNVLSILGLKKPSGETPYEYMDICKEEEFPFNKDKFKKLTNDFIKCKYGGKEIADDNYDEILKYFYSISKSVRETIGIKNYLIKYLIKMKI